MTENQNPKRNIVQRPGGFFQDLTNRFRLISRLMMDSRVNPLLKVLPVATLVYAVWPIDVPGPIDDVLVMWIGTTLFVDLCPPDVVEEHTKALMERSKPVKWNDFQSTPEQGKDVVDGEYFDTDAAASKPTETAAPRRNPPS